jgi:CelD/BcsL family acetyltransferase involved in cellulose biosynthesis
LSITPRITIARTAKEMEKVRPLWESFRGGNTTIFQDFRWNILAGRLFADREEPFVVCVEGSHGAAILPGALPCDGGSIRLLGEELFDYRAFLHRGEPDALRTALAGLARCSRPLEITAVRECDRDAVWNELELVPFSASPQVRCADLSAEQFAARHGRLGRNLRRLQRLGFQVAIHNGNNTFLLSSIYEKKASQDSASLFHDSRRIEFMMHAARLDPDIFEIFTLECGSELAAALVTLRDDRVRRFYTGWFDADLQKYSPALSLIYHVTCQSLDAGLDCDYMTGEQPYKMRLATASMPLYRLRAGAEQLAAFADLASPEQRRVG